ncbi:MAG: hypothetical protein JRJ87_03275 [Deltaproteobacteria bacterium]|nr:hypothetical protein [Deltaproteobacteria bacterium]
MLDAYIIEELKKREQSQHDNDRPTLEIPVEELPPEIDEDNQDEEDEGRVIIIDYND